MNFFKIDKAWMGAILAIIFPLLGYVFFTQLSDFLRGRILPSYAGFSFRFILVMSVCCNLLPFAVARRQRRDYQMQGIVGITLMLALSFICYVIWKGGV